MSFDYSKLREVETLYEEYCGKLDTHQCVLLASLLLGNISPEGLFLDLKMCK